MNTPARNHAYFPALDGLRGIGCLLVVVYHNFWFLHKYLFFGWLVMDIFFVLSGFLITDILLKTSSSGPYLKNFYLRRALRVFPLYFTTLVLFFFIFPRIPNFPIPLDYFIDRQAYFWTFLQNWILIFDNPGNQNALNHLWSMAVEEQFYLLWPLVFAIIPKPRVLLGGLILLLLGFSCFRVWLWMQHVPGLPYYNAYLFTRIDGICIGCMVALMQKINPRFIGNNTAWIVLAFAGINFAFYFLNQRHDNTFPYLGLVGFSTFSMIFGILVYDIINGHTPLISRLLDLRFLKFIGQISYGTYIFHWPLYLLVIPVLTQWLSTFMDGMANQFLGATIATVLAYSVGYLSFRYFETPFLNLKRHFK